MTYRVTGSQLLEQPAGTVWWVLGAFLGFPSACFICMLWREWRRLRREREALMQEEDASRAEGFPPPDPPTT